MLHPKFESRASFRRMAAVLLLAVAVLGTAMFIDIGNASPSQVQAQGACPDPAYGRQPYPYEMEPTFNNAGLDRLGSAAPTLPQVWQGYPPAEQLGLCRQPARAGVLECQAADPARPQPIPD